MTSYFPSVTLKDGASKIYAVLKEVNSSISEVDSFYRIGKKRDGRPWFIILNPIGIHDKQIIKTQARNLKTAGGFLEKVFIDHDQTPAYRQEMNWLRPIFKDKQVEKRFNLTSGESKF